MKSVYLPKVVMVSCTAAEDNWKNGIFHDLRLSVMVLLICNSLHNLKFRKDVSKANHSSDSMEAKNRTLKVQASNCKMIFLFIVKQ